MATLLLTEDDCPRSIELYRHPGGLKVKVRYDDGRIKSQNSEDAVCFGVDAVEFLGSLLPSEPVTPSDETVLLPTLPSVVPAAPLSPPHSAADLDFLEEEASDPEAATQEQFDR